MLSIPNKSLILHLSAEAAPNLNLRHSTHGCIIAENNLAGIGNYGYIWQLFWKKLMLTAVGRI